MGCRGCAGTAGYLLRDCGSVGPQPLPMSFCCAVMTQSPHTLLKRRVQHVPVGKDHLEDTKVAAFPSLCAPRERPVRQRSGLAATKEWRPGRRRATWLPTEEQGTQRARKSSVWVRATVASKKARRTGAV